MYGCVKTAQACKILHAFETFEVPERRRHEFCFLPVRSACCLLSFVIVVFFIFGIFLLLYTALLLLVTAFLIYSSGFKLFFVVFHITWRLDKKIKANCRASSDDTECNSEALQQVDLLSAQLCGNKNSLAVFSGTLSSIKLICALF